MKFKEIDYKKVSIKEFLGFLDYTKKYFELDNVKTTGILIQARNGDFPIIDIDMMSHQRVRERKIGFHIEKKTDYIELTISGVPPFFIINIPTTGVVDVYIFSIKAATSDKTKSYNLGFRIQIPNTKYIYFVGVKTMKI